jgi:osmotically-inducible protein OsmY
MRRILATLFLAATVLSGCIAPGGTQSEVVVSPYDRRSHEAIFSDADIERNFRAEMLRRSELSGPTHIRLHAYNGLALVTGEAPTEQLRDWAINLARIIPGVKQVHDYIRIGKLSSEASRRQDAQLKQSLQNALIQVPPIKGFHPSQINIVTEQGVVYLLGLVRRNEANAAINKIRGVGGVKEVVTVFTYIGK